MSHVASVFPHHDILNLAFYHLEVIQRKSENDEQDCIGLDCMSCLIALAIGVEGLINFCGHKLVIDWVERQSYNAKLKQVTAALGIEVVDNQEPWKTLAELKSLRDGLAHPKPIEREAEVSNTKELSALMESAWDPFCNSEYVHDAYEQVSLFERCIYENPDIQESGILTSAWGWGKIDSQQ